VASRSRFGSIALLPSGRHRARYRQPGTTQWVNAPTTFETKGDAQTWLDITRADLVRGAWLPADSGITLRGFADPWLDNRTLTPRTRALYRDILDKHILPPLGSTQMRKLTPAVVNAWYARTATTTPTLRAHAYSLLRTICQSAVGDNVLMANPCRIRGASKAKRASTTEPATLEELAVIVDAIPKRYKLMVLLAAWCGLRYGELAELRGYDLDTKVGLIKVRRGVTWVAGEAVVGPPKTTAGIRDVALPPHLLPTVRSHLLEFGVGRDGLLFPSREDPAEHMRPSTLWSVWDRARAKAGREDLRFHDLRHTGATLAAATGATIAELMARLGHSTPTMALRYQHAARDRDVEIAAKLSDLAIGQE
jgi:integrase